MFKLANIHFRQKNGNGLGGIGGNSPKKGSVSKRSQNRGQNDDAGSYFHEESLCITEENRFENAAPILNKFSSSNDFEANNINPGKLADLPWVDDYKLMKIF